MRIIIAAAAVLAALPATAPSQEPYVDPGMKQIVQVAIVCKDIEACSQRWARMLGQKPNPIRTTLPGREVKVLYHGKPSDGRAKLTFLNTGTTVLELMEPVGGPTAWKDFLDKNGEGVQHVAFQVEDLERTIKSLEQQGMPVIHRGRYDSNDGDYVYVDSQAKLGVTIELLHSDKK
ncbi:MAG: VOC family protein [Acidobacteriota bacterium]